MLIPDKVLHNETQRHVTRMADRDEDLIEHLDILIRGLHHQGLWDKLSTLCVAHTVSADSLLDLKGNQDSVLIGSPAFVADQGFTTVAPTALIDTQFSFDAVAHNNNSSLACYQRGTVANSYAMGSLPTVPGSQIMWFATTSKLTGVLQAQSVVDSSLNVATGGFRAISREDNSTLNTCANGVAASRSSASQAMYTQVDNLVGAVRSGDGTVFTGAGADGQYAFWAVGFGMTVSELLAYEVLIQAFFTNRGTAV